MLQVGQFIQVQTKTRDDIFGDCIYEVLETGLPAPQRARREAGMMDGIRCRLLGGSGPSAMARAGTEIVDSQEKIGQEMEQGITKLVTPEHAERLRDHYETKVSDKGTPSPGGIMEMD